MALSTLSGDEQGIILGQLRNALEPRLVMYFSSASKELRALLPPAARQQLRADYEEATALCFEMGIQDCRELREATEIWCEGDAPCVFGGYGGGGPSSSDLATLGTLGSVLPALVTLKLEASSAGPDGVSRLAEELVAGSLPALTFLHIISMHMGDAGAWALAAALDRGAMPRLKGLGLRNAAISDAGLAFLAPALRRRPALVRLCLLDNPFGDKGLAALVAPPPPAGTLPPPAGGLKKLKLLDLEDTQVNSNGCATLAAALDSGALPALEDLDLEGIPASDAAIAAVRAAQGRLARSRLAAHAKEAVALCAKLGMQSFWELRKATQVIWLNQGLSAADLATLAALCSMLPRALKTLVLQETWSGSAGPDGGQRLAEGLVAGALPAVTILAIGRMHMGDAGASEFAAALDRGALPRLKVLQLMNTAIGDAGLAVLAPALRRRPALVRLRLGGNPFGDEGLAALLAPRLAPRRRAGGLKKLELLYLNTTQVSDAGCASLAAALDSGALPALKELHLEGIPASDAAIAAVRAALARSRGGTAVPRQGPESRRHHRRG